MQLTIVVILFVLLRIVPIWGNNFPYAYDNAKDSLQLMGMWLEKKPVLLGAVTSMEGLYQGPAWYYVLFPINVFLKFHPIASVVTVILLGIITLWLLWKYVGRLEAFLYATSSSVIAAQQTAWSPYLALFSTTWILILLHRIRPHPKTIHLALIAVSVSLLFHAEIAFAVVFTILLGIVFFLRGIHPTRRQWILMATLFVIPFLPQIFFEIRHDFLETRAVLRFVSNYKVEGAKVQQNTHGVARIAEVSGYIANSGINSISPFTSEFSTTLGFLFSGGLLLLWLRQKGQRTNIVRTIIMPVIGGAFAFYLFLPVKAFYLIGLAPFWIYGFAQWLRYQTPRLIPIVVVALTILSIVSMFHSRDAYRKIAKESHILYAQKEQAVDLTYQLSMGKPFATYIYVPEVYDYTYQHIYQFSSITKHRPVPVDYSYAPHINDYMQTKKLTAPVQDPTYTFFIVESDPQKEFFERWWDTVSKGKRVIEKHEINDAITVFKLVSVSAQDDHEQ